MNEKDQTAIIMISSNDIVHTICNLMGNDTEEPTVTVGEGLSQDAAYVIDSNHGCEVFGSPRDFIGTGTWAIGS